MYRSFMTMEIKQEFDCTLMPGDSKCDNQLRRNAASSLHIYSFLLKDLYV